MNFISGEGISLFIDVALITGVFLLWLTWYRNGQRQYRLEQLLGETAQQLDEATRHLNQATIMIQQLQKQEEIKNSPTTSFEKPAAKVETVQRPLKKEQIAEPAPANLPPESSTQATMVLRMHREGEKPEAIAERLDIPLAQVKLLLKLYASKSAA